MTKKEAEGDETEDEVPDDGRIILPPQGSPERRRRLIDLLAERQGAEVESAQEESEDDGP